MKRVKGGYQGCSMKEGVLTNFTKFAGGHLCRGLIFCMVNFAGGGENRGVLDSGRWFLEGGLAAGLCNNTFPEFTIVDLLDFYGNTKFQRYVNDCSLKSQW